MRSLMIGLVALATGAVPLHAQDLAAGESSFRKCQPCHDVGESARTKIGPVLNGMDGRKAGTVEGYGYSDANKNSAIVWSETTFKDYIQEPMVKMPGTKMAFAGVKNDKEIGDLWGYLKQFSPDGKKHESYPPSACRPPPAGSPQR